jgi:CheY-like chemotaxis protein
MGEPSRSLKILLVENHEDTLVYLAKYMKRRGHEVISSRTMKQACETISQTAVDVLISDIGLPDGDGWELMKEAQKVNPPSFGIAMSGFGMQSDREKSLQAGYRHHLIKPFMPEELDVLLDEASRTINGNG